MSLKDAQLAKACLERNSMKQQKEQMEDDKNKLVAHVELLKRLVNSLLHTPLIVIYNLN